MMWSVLHESVSIPVRKHPKTKLDRFPTLRFFFKDNYLNLENK